MYISQKNIENKSDEYFYIRSECHNVIAKKWLSFSSESSIFALQINAHVVIRRIKACDLIVLSNGHREIFLTVVAFATVRLIVSQGLLDHINFNYHFLTKTTFLRQ